MSVYLLPAFILLNFLVAALRRVPVFDAFIEGAKGAVKLAAEIFPYLAAVLIAVSLFKDSGLASLVARWLSPLFRVMGIPPELTELIVVRPMSGSGSIGLLTEIYRQYGADSYPARAASVIVGSSETVFYVAALYGGGRIKKYRGAITISLIATFAGTVISCLLCRLF
ncbi:MAG TPA: spore maturation protein [Clostridiales bacterium]|nr:spore maturation protein [Clostridiales bacterium]HCU56485.1 spore maturation protein [Clostridiales bacterium]